MVDFILRPIRKVRYKHYMKKLLSLNKDRERIYNQRLYLIDCIQNCALNSIEYKEYEKDKVKALNKLSNDMEIILEDIDRVNYILSHIKTQLTTP